MYGKLSLHLYLISIPLKPIPTITLFSADSLDDCGLRFLLAMKHYGYLLRCLPIGQRAALQRAGVGTCNVVWAFHSESHEQLLQLIPGFAKGQPVWSTLRELGECNRILLNSLQLQF